MNIQPLSLSQYTLAPIEIKHMHRKTLATEVECYVIETGIVSANVYAEEVASISFLCPMNWNEKLQCLNRQIQNETRALAATDSTRQPFIRN